MSAFYDQASLVVVPSGYKSGKIYAQKPLTTDGQLTFTRASTATRVNASGLIETVASGVPRLDYTNSTCPKLLLEPQRTNYAKQSNSIATSPWSLADVTVTTNGAVSPDGTQDADILTEGTGSAQHRAQQGSLSAPAGVYTLSAYVKNVSGTRRAYLDAGPWGCFFNFSTQEVQAFGTGTASAQSVGNGWYRLVMTGTSSYTPSAIFVGLATTNETYTGDGTSAIAFYNVQFEQGTYVSSAISTTTAAVTRLGDACYKTGISSLIGQTEGTLFVEFNSSELQSYTQRIITLSDSTTNNVIGFQLTGANQITFYVENGGANQVAITKSDPAITLGQNVKLAAAYKANDFVLYLNGVQVGTDTSGSVPATSALRYSEANDSAPYIGKIAQTLLFKTRLTNAQLAELTTL
jgi:hypothetical protein